MRFAAAGLKPGTPVYFFVNYVDGFSDHYTSYNISANGTLSLWITANCFSTKSVTYTATAIIGGELSVTVDLPCS